MVWNIQLDRAVREDIGHSADVSGIGAWVWVVMGVATGVIREC